MLVIEHVRNDAHGRQNRDVNLRVAKKPEQVLPEKRRSARVILQAVADNKPGRNEETRSGNAIQ